MQSPAISPSGVVSTAGTLETEVNSFLATLNASDVVSIDRTVTSVGKYGIHMLVSYVITYTAAA